MNYKIYIAAISTVLLAACANEVIDTTLATPVEANFTGDIEAETRATSENWTAGATIGIVATSGNTATTSQYTNVKYVNESGAVTSASFTAESTKILFSDAAEKISFAAYSPYSSSVSSGAIALTASNGAVTDYLWASSADRTYTSNTANFAFTHKMAQLTVNIKLSSDFTSSETLTSTSISGLYGTASFNIKTGAVSGQTKASSNVTFTTATYSNVVIPAASAQTLTVTTTIGGQKYTTTISSALLQGNSYTYNVTATKKGLTVSGCTITGWNVNDASSSTANMTA